MCPVCGGDTAYQICGDNKIKHQICSRCRTCFVTSAGLIKTVRCKGLPPLKVGDLCSICHKTSLIGTCPGNYYHLRCHSCVLCFHVISRDQKKCYRPQIRCGHCKGTGLEAAPEPTVQPT